jgi:hypothetical protein
VGLVLGIRLLFIVLTAFMSTAFLRAYFCYFNYINPLCPPAAATRLIIPATKQAAENIVLFIPVGKPVIIT